MRRLIALIAMLLLAAAPAQAATRDVTVGPSGFATFSPATVTIGVGDTVRWTAESTNHNVVSGDPDTGAPSGLFDSRPPETMAVNDTYQFTFATAGAYDYFCNVHRLSGMKGRVVVQGPNQEPTAAFSFAPEGPTAGQTVTFDGSASSDPDPGGSIASWHWDLDANGSFETVTTGPQASRAYPSAGPVDVRLFVVDERDGQSAPVTHTVTVDPAPPTPNPGDGGSGGGGGGGAGGSGGGAGGGSTPTGPVPTAGNDVLTGTAAGDLICGLLGDDRLDGGAGDDTLFGDACDKKARAAPVVAGAGGDGNDTLLGGAGNDTLYGAGGKDRLTGGDGADKLFGGGADDKLDGGKGKNAYKAGVGNDAINARNRVVETVDCGGGRKDSATVDRKDRVRGCEKVKRARR